MASASKLGPQLIDIADPLTQFSVPHLVLEILPETALGKEVGFVENVTGSST